LLVHAAEDHEVARDPTEDLARAADQLRTSGADVEQVIVYGPPARMLAEIASQRRAKMIILAAMGASRRLFAGSVATRVAETAAVPTLVVRQGEWIARWAEWRHPLRIVAADDFSETGLAALRFLAEFAQLAPCEITVAHVDWPPEERDHLGLEQPIRYAERDAEVERAMQRKLHERTRSELGERECVLRVVPASGHIDASFVQAAAEMLADLLVVGTHQRRLAERMRLGSVSRAVLAEAHTNVLVVPPGAMAADARGDQNTNLEVAV
jgi:nucleotide-binding universal stress UspA family protein